MFGKICLAWRGFSTTSMSSSLSAKNKTKTIIISATTYCILTPINLQYSCCDGVIFADQYIGLALIRMLFWWSSQFSIKR